MLVSYTEAFRDRKSHSSIVGHNTYAFRDLNLFNLFSKSFPVPMSSSILYFLVKMIRYLVYVKVLIYLELSIV